MTVASPPKGWFRAPEGAEKTWLGLALLWCIVMSLAMPYWHFAGRQNSTGESYRVEPAKFVERVDKFIAAGKVEDRKINEIVTLPVVQPAADPTRAIDIYLLAAGWQWKPILKLKKDQEYRLHISSADYQHGFSLYPLNMNFQVLPGYDHVLTLTPTEAGKYTIICNEYCGYMTDIFNHHTMTGLIEVE